MINNIKKFFNFISNKNYTKAELSVIELSFAIRNVKFCKITFPCLALFDLILMIVYAMIFEASHPLYNAYIICYSVFFVFLLIFWALLLVTSKQMEKNVTKILHITVFFSITTIIWAIVISSLDLTKGGHYAIYLTSIMAVGCGLYYTPRIIFAIETSSLLIFAIVIQFLMVGADKQDVYLNLCIFSFILLVISLMKSRESINIIRQNMVIKANNAELQSLNMLLEKASSYDKLTGIKNRSSLNAKLESSFEIAKINSYCLTVAMFDLDNFKEINDTYGHSIGDKCLQSVTQCFKGHIGLDSLFRYGGEEYTVIFVNTPSSEIQQLLEHIRSCVETREHTDKCLKITVSGGIFSKIPIDSVTAEDYLKIADRALYEAKENGKNKLVFKEY